MDNISTSSTVQDDRYQKSKIANVFYRFIIVFLLLLIITAVVFFIGVIEKKSYIPEDVSTIIKETLLCKEYVSEDIETKDEKLINEWGIYSYPEYGVLIELPSYTNTREFNEQDYTYVWSIYSEEKKTDVASKVFNNYEKTVRISFRPVVDPDLDCGGGCLGDSMIFLDLYKRDNADIISVKNKFESYVNQELDKYGEEKNLITNDRKISNKEGFSFSYQVGIDEENGYVLLLDKYIVLVRKYIYSEGEDLNIANKVFESIRFN